MIKQTPNVKEYINIKEMQDYLLRLYTKARDSFGEAKYRDFIESKFDDGYLKNHAVIMSLVINKEMRLYLHRDNFFIPGSMNSVDWDYKEQNPGGDIRNLVHRLDRGQHDTQTDKDRDWLTKWYIDTFSEYAIKYKFIDIMNDRLDKYIKNTTRKQRQDSDNDELYNDISQEKDTYYDYDLNN